MFIKLKVRASSYYKEYYENTKYHINSFPRYRYVVREWHFNTSTIDILLADITCQPQSSLDGSTSWVEDILITCFSRVLPRNTTVRTGYYYIVLFEIIRGSHLVIIYHYFNASCLAIFFKKNISLDSHKTYFLTMTINMI